MKEDKVKGEDPFAARMYQEYLKCFFNQSLQQTSQKSKASEEFKQFIKLA